MSIFSEIFNLSGREEEIDAVIAVVTLSTISVVSLTRIYKSLPKKIAIPFLLFSVFVLSIAVYDDYAEILTVFFPKLGYFATDPACADIVQAAQKESQSCQAYVFIVADEIQNGSKSIYSQYSASTFQTCIDDSLNFTQIAQNNYNNVPVSSRYDLDSLMDAERYYGQILTYPNTIQIPAMMGNKFSFPQDNFDIGIQGLLNSCQERLFF